MLTGAAAGAVGMGIVAAPLVATVEALRSDAVAALEKSSSALLEKQQLLEVLQKAGTDVTRAYHRDMYNMGLRTESLLGEVDLLKSKLSGALLEKQRLTDSLTIAKDTVQSLTDGIQVSEQAISLLTESLKGEAQINEVLTHVVTDQQIGIQAAFWRDVLKDKLLLLQQLQTEQLLAKQNFEHVAEVSTLKSQLAELLQHNAFLKNVGSIQEASLELAELKSSFLEAHYLDLLLEQESVYLPLLEELQRQVIAHKKALAFLGDFVKIDSGSSGLAELAQHHSITSFHRSAFGFDETDILNFLVEVLPKLYRDGKLLAKDEAQEVMYDVALQVEHHMPQAKWIYGELYDDVIAKYDVVLMTPENLCGSSVLSVAPLSPSQTATIVPSTQLTAANVLSAVGAATLSAFKLFAAIL